MFPRNNGRNKVASILLFLAKPKPTFTWVETRSRFVEEQQAQEKARQYLGDMYDVRVFVQFDSEPDMQEVI